MKFSFKYAKDWSKRLEKLFNTQCNPQETTTTLTSDSTQSGKQEQTGQIPTDKDCRFCGIRLTAENWSPSNVIKKDYKCRPCFSIVCRQNYLRRKAKTLNTKTIKAFNQIKEGYIYAITNPAWAGWVKIGMAVDADDRLSNYQTSSPFRDYHIEAKQFTTDKKKLEEIAHKEAAKLGVQLGEWFKINKLQAISLIKSLTLETT